MTSNDDMFDSEKHLELFALIKALPVAFYHIDLVNQRFLMVNEYMCLKTGYSEEELLSMKPMALLTSKSRAFFRERLMAMTAGEKISSDIELEITTKSGDVEWGRLHIHHNYENGRINSAYVVAHFITEQRNAQKKLTEQRQELQKLAKSRTSELAKINKKLRKEIRQRSQATEKLQAYSERLEEMNTAMRVLLDKRKEDHVRSEELIRMNLKALIDPYLERLRNSDLRKTQRQLVDVIRINLDEVVGSATPTFSSKFFKFSPNELQVVNLIRSGKSTKDIAKLMNLSTRTIEAYRHSIRKKLNLKNTKVNLRTYLSTL